MIRMLWLLYYALLFLLVTVIRISAFWNEKSANWIEGRKKWKQKIDAISEKQSRRIWFHVSSLGEFEQARPVIERIKQRDPSIHIILSFFSPSGYEIRKNYPFADVYYLPADLPGNAKYWVEKIKPDLAVFVKYDFWPGYLRALVRNKIPFVVISAHFKPGLLSSWSLPLTKSLLKKANKIFLQNDEFKKQLMEIGFHNLQVAGDTRIDRTLILPEEAKQKIPDALRNFGIFDIIAGSTWEADERILIPVIQRFNLKAILAPHDVREKNIERLMASLPKSATRLSRVTTSKADCKVIVIDNIGLLAYVYSLGKIAYIGGGFGSGIHNVLEPAAHGVPVLFGPKYSSFPEAEALISLNAAKSVTTQKDLETAIQFFSMENGNEAGKSARLFLEKNEGATEIVSSYILESIPFGGKV